MLYLSVYKSMQYHAMNQKETYEYPILEVVPVELSYAILDPSDNLENPGEGGEWNWD